MGTANADGNPLGPGRSGERVATGIAAPRDRAMPCRAGWWCGERDYQSTTPLASAVPSTSVCVTGRGLPSSGCTNTAARMIATPT